jgi:sec-independent protein translocase protein TatA
MFGLGMPELIIILVIVLVIFGANRLPQLGEGLGKAIKGFKKGISEPPTQNSGSDDAAKKENKS